MAMTVKTLCNYREGVSRTPEDTLARVTSIADIQSQIEQQRQRIGQHPVMEGFISKDQEKLFLKVWWAKTELRRKHLALLEEKRPLDAVRTGTQTKLGLQYWLIDT
jgi:hypothetical protein